MIHEQSKRIGTYIHESLLKLGITRRYFGEFPYSRLGSPRLEECLSFYTAEERDLVYRHFSAALRDWVAELQIVRVDHLSATMPGGFRHDLNLLVESLQVKTTEDAYGVMLRAAEQIHHRVCGHAQP